MAYAWHARRAGSSCAISPAARQREDFFMWRCRPARAGAERRRDQPAARLVRARDRRPVRGRVHAGIRSRTAWCCTRARDRSCRLSTQVIRPIRRCRSSPRQAGFPEIAGADVQRLPFGPVRADVVESAEFVFFYVGEQSSITIRSCSSSIAAWRSGSRAARCRMRSCSRSACRGSAASPTRWLSARR